MPVVASQNNSKQEPMKNLVSFFSRRLIILFVVLSLSGCLSNPPQQVDETPQADIVGQPESQPGEPASEQNTSPEWPAASTAEPLTNDLWQRIRAGYQLDIPDNAPVRRELKTLARKPDYMLRITARAEPYLYYIVEQAEQRDMPLELVMLPAVESGFQPYARSPERAAGLWQFIPSTGRAFGLRRDWWYEGRHDITESTEAALDYLSDLAKQFGGDWQLALAAYNAGPGTVRKAIKRNRKKGLATDFWSLKLPRETRHYVPRLLAVAKVVADPDAYALSLTPIDNEPHFTRVELPSQLDLAMAAEVAGLKPKDLKRLNPGLRRWATAPDGPHHLLLPIEQAQSFRAKIKAVPPEKWVNLHRYRIRQGDSLGRIAHHYGVSVAALKRANRLRDNTIRAGRYLLIPVDSSKKALLASAKDNAPARLPKKTSASSSNAKTGMQHIVQPGDTLWEIARAHQISHRQLAAWNGLSVNDTLRPGQTLIIKTNNARDGAFFYRVQRGDSLYLIARRFNVSIKDLKRWNSLSGPYLQPGQKLTLHLQGASTATL
jgi:membrane-bound lytic murein transglycosylase D